MATIAMPVAEGFEDSELTVPRDRLRGAGHEVVLLGEKRGATVEGKRGKAKVTVDATADEVEPSAFDALVIPGGHAPDHLRTVDAIVTFVRKFVPSNRPVAAICHGPQLLIEAEAVAGKTLTSAPSIEKDLINAGATWVDREVVEDGSLITSRKPDDLDAFCAAILRRLDGAAVSSRSASPTAPQRAAAGTR